MSDVNVDAQLKGNTLRVYVYALKKRKVGVREVQRALRLSNPSLAQYHLNKLRELGLLRAEGGDYEFASEVKVDVRRDFLRVGTMSVRLFVFYAVCFAVFAAYVAILAYHMYVYVLLV